MPKELIVSVNGREKKIAIVENEKVTEFYIERGEEHQGIVGNIYKGRVMRVLPGMQSAFVDIGLERDAFLYVSDFFDEEEEFERIVMDKSKKAEPREDVERAAREGIERARLEREHRMEATQERAEPLREAEPIFEQTPEALIESVYAAEELVDEPAQAAATVPIAVEQAEETEAVGGRSKRSRRGRRRGKGSDVAAAESREADERTADAIETATPFIAADSSFERVVDEDEIAAAEDGEMFKDARLQERLLDQIHAVEFDMESVPSAEVGSLLSSNLSSGTGFERVSDSDEEAPASTAPVQEAVAAHIDAFVDELNEETSGPQFERVSDEGELVEAEAVAEQTTRASVRARSAARLNVQRRKPRRLKQSPSPNAPRAKRARPRAPLRVLRLRARRLRRKAARSAQANAATPAEMKARPTSTSLKQRPRAPRAQTSLPQRPPTAVTLRPQRTTLMKTRRRASQRRARVVNSPRAVADAAAVAEPPSIRTARVRKTAPTAKTMARRKLPK